MMRPSGKMPVYLHRLPVDFRKAINGLALIVQEAMRLDPYSEALFVFINKSRDRIKLLYWERNGFCLWHKRLEKNKFAWPLKQNTSQVKLSVEELNWLLDGFDIWRMPPHQRLFYDRVGRVVLLAAGTGNPFFTTDTTAVLRAAELEAQAVLKATNVDGVYTADPKKDPKAKRYDRLSHQEAIEKDLRVMDGTAFALARENRMPIIIFSIADKGAIESVLRGKGRATTVG